MLCASANTEREFSQSQEIQKFFQGFPKKKKAKKNLNFMRHLANIFELSAHV